MADSHHSTLFRNLCILHLQRLTLELKCPLCLNLLKNPLLFPCNHIFCNDCIAMSEESKQKCPTCWSQCLGQEIRSAPYMEGIVRLCQSLEETVNAKAYQSSSAGKLPTQTKSTTNIRCNARKEHPPEILGKRIYANSPSGGLVNNSKGEIDSKKLRPAAHGTVVQSPKDYKFVDDDDDVNYMIKEEPHTEDYKVAEGNTRHDLVNNSKGNTDLKKLRPAACAGVKESPDCVVISDDEDTNTIMKEEPPTEDYKIAEGNNTYPDNLSLMAVGRKSKVKRAVQLVNKYKKRRLANRALVTEKQMGLNMPTSAHVVPDASVVVSNQSVGAPNLPLRDEYADCANSSGSKKERVIALCTHGMGSKSLARRMYEEEKATGKKPSALKILMKVNEKKDKYQRPTGEYYNLALQDAIWEYVFMYRLRHGAEVDPADYPIERNLWLATGPVSRVLSHGRVLGLGTTKQAEYYMV